MELTKTEKRIFEILEKTAKNRKTITYSELGRMVNIPPFYIGHILFGLQNKLNRYPYPPLNYLVVNKQTGISGDGANIPHGGIRIDPIVAREKVWKFYSEKKKIDYNGIYYYYFPDDVFYFRFFDSGIVLAIIAGKSGQSKKMPNELAIKNIESVFSGNYNITDNNIDFTITKKNNSKKYICSGKIKWDWTMILNINKLPDQKKYLGTFNLKKIGYP